MPRCGVKHVVALVVATIAFAAEVPPTVENTPEEALKSAQIEAAIKRTQVARTKLREIGDQGSTEDEAAAVEREAAEVPTTVENTPEQEVLKSTQIEHEAAIKRTQIAMTKLREIGGTFGNQSSADDEAAAIEREALEISNHTIQHALKEIRSNIAAIKDATVTGNLTSIPSMVENSRQAAKTLKKAGEVESKSMRKLWEQKKKSDKQKVAVAAAEAIKSARYMKHVSRAFERAQRKAGIRESVYEKGWDHNEQQAEQWQEKAEQLRDSIKDKVEQHYGHLENRIERVGDSTADQTEHTAEKLVKEFERAAEQAFSGKAGPPSKAADVAIFPQFLTGGANSLSQSEKNVVGSAFLFFCCCAVMGVAVSASSFAMNLRARRNIRGSPLLG